MHGRTALAIFLFGSLWLLTGCTSGPDAPGGRFTVAPGQYEAAFDAAREELTELGFTLERIDARAGVITTEPLGSGGLGTPWDPQQLTLGAEIADFAHTQLRRVRLTFTPASDIDRLPSDEPASQISGGPVPTPITDIAQTTPLVGEVQVVIERLYQPNWRPSALSVNYASRAGDPSLRARGIGRTIAVPVARDEPLARRLAGRLAQKLARTPD